MSYLTENQGDKDAENLLTYTEYNINVYDEKDNDWKPMTIKVPDGVNFYKEDFRIAEPYTTIVHTDKCAEWIEYLKGLGIAKVVEFGKYSIITLSVLIQAESGLPEINRYTDWLINQIYLSRYVIAVYNGDNELQSLRRIFDFRNIYDISVAIVTRKDFTNGKPRYIMGEFNNLSWDNIAIKTKNVVIYDDKEAMQIWSTTISKNLKRMWYEEDYVVKDLSVDKLSDANQHRLTTFGDNESITEL